MDDEYVTSGAILYQIEVSNALQNYIYLLHCRKTSSTFVVDPTEAKPVLDLLEHKGWTLNAILCTHHHADHIGGNLKLKAATGCEVIGYSKDSSRIKGITRTVEEGETLKLGALEAHIMDVSGHTIGHIAYYIKSEKLLFSGDTLFSMGCGRLFEGTPAQMVDSLSRISALPDDTMICPTHEYTLANGRFALHVDPDNLALQQRVKEATLLREQGTPTVPVSLGMEKATNPFLRVHNISIRQHLGMADASETEIFAELRRRKDKF